MIGMLAATLAGIGAWIALRSRWRPANGTGAALFVAATLGAVLLDGISSIFLVAAIAPAIVGTLYLLDLSERVSVPP